MAINLTEDTGYVKGSPDSKEANGVLRDITGAAVNGFTNRFDSMRDVTGMRLTGAEFRKLSQIFNTLPEGLQTAAAEAGIKTDAAPAIADPAAFTDQDRQQLRDIISKLTPEQRIRVEEQLKPLSMTLEDVADKPEEFVLQRDRHLLAMPPEDRAAFERRVQEALEETRPDRRHPETEEAAHDVEPSHDAMAFMAFAIGSPEASRIHEYLRRRGSDSTHLGDESEEDEEDEKLQKSIANQYVMDLIADINNQISSIDMRLGEIARRIGEIDKRVGEIDLRLQKIEEETTELQDKKKALEEQNTDLQNQDQAVTVQLDSAQARAAQADTKLAEADGKVEDALSSALTSQDGHKYQKNADGQYVYVDGPNQGQVVADDQRASWWEERWAETQQVFGGKTAEQIIAAQKERDALREQSEAAGKKVEELQGRRDEIRTHLRENRRDIRNIDQKLEALGIEAKGLNEEKTKLLLEKEGLSKEQKELLEKRAELVHQRDELRSQGKEFFGGEYKNAIETAALNNTLSKHLEEQVTQMENLSEAQGRWANMAAANIAYRDDGTPMTRSEINAKEAESGVCTIAVTEDEYTSMLQDMGKTRQEIDQLKQVLDDVKAGKPINMAQLPQSVREEVVVASLKSDPGYYRAVDFNSFSTASQQRIVEAAVTSRLDAGGEIYTRFYKPEHRDIVATTILNHEKGPQHLASLETNINEFSEPVQKQIIEASIKQDLQLGREIDIEKRFPPELRGYASQFLEQQRAQQQSDLVASATSPTRTISASTAYGYPPPGGSVQSAFTAAANPPEPEDQDPKPSAPAIQVAQNQSVKPAAFAV